jgi:hypothetical protein
VVSMEEVPMRLLSSGFQSKEVRGAEKSLSWIWMAVHFWGWAKVRLICYLWSSRSWGTRRRWQRDQACPHSAFVSKYLIRNEH